MRAGAARVGLGAPAVASLEAPTFTSPVYGPRGPNSRVTFEVTARLPAPMRLSVIIPTHDRPGELRSCLETLQAQEGATPDLEVIVVDDGSTVDVQGVVNEVAAAGPVLIRSERLEFSGLNAARNRGVEVSGGELIAFLDDDTLVSPRWASAMLEAFDDHDCAAVGGRVELKLAGPAPPWLTDLRCYLAEFDRGDQPHLIDEGRLPVGANCAVRRSEFDRIDGFIEGLDRIRGSLLSNGDTEFFTHLRARGGQLWYEPKAHVFHCVPANRLTPEFFRNRLQAQSVSDELLLRIEGHRPSLGHRYALSRKAMTAAADLCSDLLRRRDTTRSRLWLGYWTGRLRALRIEPPARRT
jgi:glycosyltransferase involved in cell wall biosynthesis